MLHHGRPWRDGRPAVFLSVEITVEELERIDPAEPREIDAMKHHIRQLHHESWKARDAVSWFETQLEAARSVSSRA